MADQLESFYPIFLYLIVVIGFAATTLTFAHLPFLKPTKRSSVKDMPYESGMDPIGDARQHFDVKFYLIAVLFLIFDVELLFLYPWAISAYVDGGIPVELRLTVFWVMLGFLGMLAIAYVYEWRMGGFKWR